MLADACAVEADGPVRKWLLDTLDAGGSNGRQLAELGIGTNPAATLSGSILEDEKVLLCANAAAGSGRCQRKYRSSAMASGGAA